MISSAKILEQLNQYSKTPRGKAKMDEALRAKMSKRGGTGTGGVTTAQSMEQAAQKLIGYLRQTAQSHDLPGSVMKHFDTLTYSKPKELPNGDYCIEVYFGGDLSRESLYKESPEYDGVDNIIAVLNNGYDAENYVYGEWHGQKIRSLKSRAGLHFIQQAILDFNTVYGKQYDVTATENEIYKR